MKRRGGAVLIVLAMLAACSSGNETTSSDAESSEPPLEGTASGPPPSASGTSPTSTPPPPPTTVPREARTLTAVGPETDEVTEVEIDPGPTTFGQVVDFGVRAGLWDEAEGVIRVLDYVVGVLPAEQVPGVDEVLTGELTEILRRAEALIETTTDDDDRGVLELRTSMILPSQETLEEIANQPGVKRNGFASHPTAGSGCQQIDPDGWDPTTWIEGCYEVIERVLGDATLRVFYPEWYDADASLVSLTAVALDALDHSVATFRSLGRVGNIDLIFSVAETQRTIETLGSATRSETGGVVDGCRVTLWPGASVDSIDEFEQTIAHEAWHCVQYYDGMEGDDADWFVEGGAAFFSNVAYPSADAEHGWLETFDSQPETAIHAMSYETWIWWQHLSNEFSPAYVADLHRQMYGKGLAIEALNGLDAVFHDFVADFVGAAVIDQSGAVLPRATYFVNFPVVKAEDEGRELTRTFTSWAPVRWHIPYDKELRVLQTDATERGLRSMVEWDKRFDRSSWQGVHPEVRSTCTEPARFAGVVTDAGTDGLSSALDFTVVVDTVERAECDPCLLGTWSLDLDTFEAMILAAAASEGGGLPPEISFEIGGAYYTAFDENSTIHEQRDGLTITSSLGGAGEATFTINSFATGQYSADGETLTIRNLVESYNEVKATIPYAYGSYSFPGAIQNGTAPYICDGDTLQMTVETYPPVTHTRVDKILIPPDAPTDPDAATPDEG